MDCPERRRAGQRPDLLAAAALVAAGAFAAPFEACAFEVYEGDRKVVFECPCSAEFTPDGNGEGTLVLRFGLRNHRDVRSGEVGLFFNDNPSGWGEGRPLDELQQPQGSLGEIAPNGSASEFARSFRVQDPEPGASLLVELWEALEGQRADPSDRYPADVARHELLSLWPVPGRHEGGAIRYVDILTDTDGDGVGDVNERKAETDPDDPSSTPGASTVDVLWLYQASLGAADPVPEYHHAAAVANAMFMDSGTNLRLRSVGFVAVGKDNIGSHGVVEKEHLDKLMDRHGADLHNFWYDSGDEITDPCPPNAGGCAALGDSGTLVRTGPGYYYAPFPARGVWRSGGASYTSVPGPFLIAHELGHVLRLAHSALQGDKWGVFRWSRGHYWERNHTLGTIMTYGVKRLTPVFSSPISDRCRSMGVALRPARHAP